MKPATCLVELFEVPPTSDAEREARWAQAVDAVHRVRPALAIGGGPALHRWDLRLAFTAIDLFVLQGRYRAVFDYTDDIYWSWCLSSTDGPCDAWSLVEPDEEDVLVDGWVMTRRSTLVEFVVHAARLDAVFPPHSGPTSSTPAPAIFDDHPARDVVEAIVGAIGRRMMRFAATFSTGSSEEAAEQERLLLTTFGEGPGQTRIAAT